MLLPHFWGGGGSQSLVYHQPCLLFIAALSLPLFFFLVSNKA